MKETDFHFERNIEQNDTAWQEYQEYLSGFGIQISEPDFAFSKKSRKKIRSDVDNSPYPDYDFGSNECCHEDHGKQTGYYDDPSNGKLRNRPKHYIQHKLGARGDLDTGLTEDQDSWSAKKIWNRMSDDEKDYLRRIA